MIKIPQNNKWVQANRGSIIGNLWSTMNIDLQSNVGAVRASPRLKYNTGTADDADLGCPVAFKHFNNKIWAICDTHIFTNSGEVDDPFTDDATTTFQTDYDDDESDLEIFNGVLCATTTDALYSTDGSDWTVRDALSTGTNHVMTYFKKFDRLYYSNASDNIISIDTSWATADPGVDYAISLSGDSNGYTISCMKASSTWIWIGIVDRTNPAGPGKVLQWDGFSATVSNEYKIPAGCVSMAIDPKSDTPVIVDGQGVIRAFNGGFKEVARFPFVNKLPYNPVDVDNERFIHPNGMQFHKNGTLYLLINNRSNVSSVAVPENCPSGVWEYSESNGLVHRYSLSYNPAGSSTITDYGQNMVSRVGALAIMDLQDTSAVDGTLLVGASYFTDATTTTSAIFFDNSLDTIQKNGYFVTTKIFSPNIVEAWKNIALRFRRLLDSSNKIVVKYRTTEETATEATITWTSTTTFTTTTDVSAYYDSTLGRGYEVEVLRGKGSGKCAHTTSIVNNAGTYTVTVDETFTGATSGTATARFQKWIKIDSIDSQRIDYENIGLNLKTPWIQFKVFMQFKGEDELYDLVLTHEKSL